jgi:hypothetical protein
VSLFVAVDNINIPLFLDKVHKKVNFVKFFSLVVLSCKKFNYLRLKKNFMWRLLELV